MGFANAPLMSWVSVAGEEQELSLQMNNNGTRRRFLKKPGAPVALEKGQ